MVHKSTEISWKIYSSGYCTAHNRVIDPQKGRGKARFYATWMLIDHPTQGKYLFDTGYSEKFNEATRRFPDRLYRWATPVNIKANETAKVQLAKDGILPEEINGIILSHLHADHVAGLCDFPDIPIYCTRQAWVEYISLNGFAAVRKAILKGLFPKDIAERIKPIEFGVSNEITERDGLQMQNFFENDEAMQIIWLPGHAKGQIGLRVKNSQQAVLFCADAAWRTDTLKRGVLPKSVIKIFIDNWQEYCGTFYALKNYAENNPDEKVMFTHCPETLEYVV